MNGLREFKTSPLHAAIQQYLGMLLLEPSFHASKRLNTSSHFHAMNQLAALVDTR